MPEVPYDEPTDEERRLGSWFGCIVCSRDWPLRLADVREPRHCANCGRAKRRERQAKARARAREGTVEKPMPMPEATLRQKREAGSGPLDWSDPALHEELYAGKVPEEVSQEIDALIEQAARRR